MKVVWTVKKNKQRCTFEHFSDAWNDFKSHDEFVLIYPKLMSNKQFSQLKEFDGW